MEIAIGLLKTYKINIEHKMEENIQPSMLRDLQRSVNSIDKAIVRLNEPMSKADVGDVSLNVKQSNCENCGGTGREAPTLQDPDGAYCKKCSSY